MPPDEPTLYSLGVQIARVEGKLDGYQQAAVARENALVTRLDESLNDRRDLHRELDGVIAWKNKATGALIFMSTGLLAVGSLVAARIWGLHP